MTKPEFRYKQILLLTILSVLACPSQSAYSLRNINVLNLLMPFSNEVQMKYMIQAYNGCYNWNSKFPETIRIRPLTSQEKQEVAALSDSKDHVRASCENAAMVSVGKRNDYDGIVWLTATDVETKEILKCEAKVKPIRRLQILTKFRTLDVGDHEQVELIAFDEENNSFTTLEGLKFEWSVRGEGQADFVNYRDSNFKTTKERHRLEDMNYQTDIVILRGIRTGRVTLSVKLLDRSYQSEISTTVDIFVIEHFEIEPQRDMFLMPCSEKQLKLFTVRTVNYKLQRTEVRLPNQEFLWSTGNKALVELRPNGVLRSTKELGSTKYIVKDRAKDDNKIERKVSVVIPRNINLYVKQITAEEAARSIDSEEENLEEYENNWNLLKGRYYRVLIGLFDQRNNRISLGDKDRIEFSFEKREFEVVNRARDFIVLRPITTIKDEEPFAAQLVFRNQNCLSKKYSVRKKYSILSELKIVRASAGIVTLPTGGQEMRLFALGGSGNYEWSSSNTDILQLKQNGVVRTLERGVAEVVVRDRNNIKNQATLSVAVIEAALFRLVERKIEMLKGGSRELMFSAVDVQGNAFTYCDSLQFVFDSQSRKGLEIEPRSFASESVEEALEQNRRIRNYLKKTRPGLVEQWNQDYEVIFTFSEYEEYLQQRETTKEALRSIFGYYQNYGVCSGFQFASDSPGEYDLQHALLKKKGIVRVYEHYRFDYPNGYDKKLFGERPVLLLGSGGVFTFREGPWIWKDSKHEKLKYSVRISDESKQDSVKILGILDKNGDTQVFVKCDADVEGGEVDIEILGQNEPDADLVNPVQVKGTLRIACKLPASVRMFKLKENDSEWGHLRHERKKLGLSLGKEYPFVVELFDDFEHLFWRKKSGIFEWAMDNSQLGEFIDQDTQEDKNTLRLFKGKVGTGWARARLSAVRTKISRDGTYSGSKRLSQNLEDKLQVEGLDKLTLSSEHILLYYHPDMEYFINIENGSGDFNVIADNDYLEHRYDFKGKRIIIKPKRLGSTVLEVEDLGTEAKMKAVTHIDVVEIRRIEIEAEHPVLEEKKETQVHVRVYDELERLIPKDQYQLMQLEMGVLGGMAQFMNVKDIEDPKGDELYVIKAQKAGKYQLQVTGKDFDGYVRKSNKANVDVFEKMKIFPETLILGRGCVTGFEIRGGPEQAVGNRTDFEIQIEQQGEVGELVSRENGRFEFKAKTEGKEEVTIKLINRKTGKVVGLSLLKIFVVVPDGVDVIGIESRKMLTSSLGRLIAIPTYNKTRFTPALCPINFEWENLNPNIVEVEQSSDEACGDLPKSGDEDLIREKMENLFINGWQSTAKNVRGLSPGFADVEITAQGFGRKFKTNVNLEVIDGVGVVRDKFIKIEGCEEGILLLPPNSFYQVRLMGVPLSSNSDFDFSILQSQQQKLLRTNANGFLRSSHEEGYVLLKISEKKNPSNELLVPVVILKPVSLVVEDSSKIALVPEQSFMSLRVRLIDSLGRVFAHPLRNFELSALSSDSNILDAFYQSDKGELEISTKKQGQATVMVSHRLLPDKLIDVLPIKVGSLISPASPVDVHVGGTVNFKINNQVLLDKSKWKSSDDQVVRVESGQVKAVGPGKAELRFDETVRLSSLIRVFAITQIIEEDVISNVVTNIPVRKEFRESYHFMFKLLSEGREINLLQSQQDKPEIDHNLNWGCLCLSDSFVVTRQKFLKPQNTLPYMGCVLRFSDFEQEAEYDFGPSTSIVFFLENKQSGFRLEHRVNIHVIHGFHFMQKNLISEPIQMDENSRSRRISIRTQKILQVSTEPPHLARHVKFSFDSSRSLLTLDVDLPENFSDQRIFGNISITSPESGQSSRVVIIYDPSSSIIRRLSNLARFSPFFWTSLSFSDFLLVLIAVAALVVVLVYLRCFSGNDKYEPFRSRNYMR